MSFSSQPFARVACPALVLVAVALLAVATRAQGGWNIKTPSRSPTVDAPAIAYDSSTGNTVAVVGGANNPEQTWIWDGSNWTRRFPPANPVGRVETTVTYDSVRDFVILYGGYNIYTGNTQYGDTLEYDGTNWEGRANGTPSRRWGAAIVYDAGRQETVLFGGCYIDPGNALFEYNETWVWLGGAWIQRNPPTRPAPRHGHAIAYDSARQRVVLFGGKGSGQLLDDTWEWNGSNWTEVFPTTRPSPRTGSALAYVTTTGRCVLFGGRSHDGQRIVPMADTWTWDGAGWAQMSTIGQPARRSEHGMVYDAMRDVVLVFGGSNAIPTDDRPLSTGFMNDTWEYTPGTPSTYTFYGSGCAGSRGVPFLSTPSGNAPVAGQTFEVQLNNLPLTGSTFMFMGISNTNYGGLLLPFDLIIIGAPGCNILASGEILFPVTNVLGVGLWSVLIPVSLAGATFYNQGIVFDPPANTLGITVTDGGAAFVGT